MISFVRPFSDDLGISVPSFFPNLPHINVLKDYPSLENVLIKFIIPEINYFHYVKFGTFKGYDDVLVIISHDPFDGCIDLRGSHNASISKYFLKELGLDFQTTYFLDYICEVGHNAYQFRLWCHHLSSSSMEVD